MRTPCRFASPLAACALLSISASSAMGDEALPTPAETPAQAAAPVQALPQVQLSPEAIRSHYAAVTAFTADVDQEKKAAFLARPLKSTATLSMKDGRIEWRTLKPIASFVAIDADGIHMEQPGVSGQPAAASAMEKAGKDPRAAAFIGFLRSLFALDFPGIEKDFVLTFEGDTMKARPKATSSLGAMIHAIDVSFQPDLSVRRVVVETKDETTTMNFKNFAPVTAANP